MTRLRISQDLPEPQTLGNQTSPVVPSLPQGVPSQGHLSSIPVLVLLTSSLPEV